MEPTFNMQCNLYCKHYEGLIEDSVSFTNQQIDKITYHKCAAFPKGIPTVIFNEVYDHREPFKGDHGIQFEIREGDPEEINKDLNRHFKILADNA